MSRLFDPAIDADLKANYGSEGYTPKHFAVKYNLPVGTIHQRAHHLGLTCNQRWPNEQDAIFAAYQAGDTLRTIAKRYRHSRSTIRAALAKASIAIRPHTETSQRYNIAADTFSRIDTHEKAYWLGFLYADGNVYLGSANEAKHVVQLCLSAKDAAHVERFRAFLKSNHPLYWERQDTSVRFMANNQELVRDLMALGCVPRKSLTLQFPTEEQVPRQYRSSFILGYADGDGSICRTRAKWHWEIVGTRAFNTAVQDELVQMAGLSRTKLSVEKRSPNLSLCYLVYGGGIIPTENPRALHHLPALYAYLYLNSPVWLPRKRARFEDYLNARYPNGWQQLNPLFSGDVRLS